jgi:hypothetical protein
VRIHKTNHVNYELVKNGGACVLSTMFSIHNISSILIEFQQQRFKKTMEREKNEELINLGP